MKKWKVFYAFKVKNLWKSLYTWPVASLTFNLRFTEANDQSIHLTDPIKINKVFILNNLKIISIGTGIIKWPTFINCVFTKLKALFRLIET